MLTTHTAVVMILITTPSVFLEIDCEFVLCIYPMRADTRLNMHFSCDCWIDTMTL